MVLVTVLRRFRDFVAKCDRNVGDKFAATEKRAEYIDAKLPGYITFEPIEPDVADATEPESEPERADLSKLTVATLKTLAKERGIDVPKSAKKAQIVALLEE